MRFKQIRYLAVLLFAASLSATSHAAWEPSYVDNFSGSQLSAGKWVRGQENLDRQLQSYRDEAIVVRNGMVQLKVINKPFSNRPYIAGAITSQGLFAQKYGYFEVRAKMAKGPGLWPAFWLMPVSGKWSSEIDIFEYVGNHPRSLHHSMHHDNRLQLKNTGIVKDAGMDLSETWNVYALHWTPTSIRYLINGKVTHEVNDPSSVSKASDPMFVMLNTALASQHTGWVANVAESTDFNQTFEVDYVRVYRETNTGAYQTIPSSSQYVADTRDSSYDGVGISVTSLDDGTPPIMRKPGYISDTLRLTSHAAGIAAKVWISLHEATDFQDNGRFANRKVQIIEKKVTFESIGQTLDIPYEFRDKLINSPGLYYVDVVVRDATRVHNNRAAARYKTFQYLDDSKPTEALYLDGFIRNIAARSGEDEIQVDTLLQVQEATLTPYLNVHYRLLDSSRNPIGNTIIKRLDFDYIGEMKVSHSLPSSANTKRASRVSVQVFDAANKKSMPIKEFPIATSNRPGALSINVR